MKKEDELFTPDVSAGNPVFPSQDNFVNFTMQFQQMMLLYESAVKCVTMRLELMINENKAVGGHTGIRSVSSRIKEPRSINKKLQKMGQPISFASIQENLNDVAGVRVICSYLEDIYHVRDELLKGGQIILIGEKDYIKNPKPNGYRSLHLIVNVLVPRKGGVESVKCEIQLRTTAMDCWAALEHQLRYKKETVRRADIDSDLKRCAMLLHETDSLMQDILNRIEEVNEFSIE